MDAVSSHPIIRPASGSTRLLGDLRALAAVARKEWLYFVRYPSWMISLLIWPLIFPLAYILSARALAGPDGSGLLLFTTRTGISDYMGYIAVGTTIWMWQNVVLWNVGFALRNEQMRGTLEIQLAFSGLALCFSDRSQRGSPDQHVHLPADFGLRIWAGFRGAL